MHDLRHDPDESPGGAPTAHRLDPADLRTVPMPDLRTAEARLLDAAARGIEGEDGEPRDVRTFPEMVVAELVRLVDVVQALRLLVDTTMAEQARTIADLVEYIRDHSEGDA